MPSIAKRRKIGAVEEISFDEDARSQYLTGFHKRKQQRIKQAKEAAAQREREEKIKERQQMREERQRQLEEHVNTVNSMLRSTNGSTNGSDKDGDEELDADEGEEWQGFEEAVEVNRVDEYVDEDKYAVVTVEAVDVSKDGLHATAEGKDSKTNQSGSDTDSRISDQDISNGKQQKKRKWTKEKPGDAKPKKRKKFRYESAAERKEARQKQKAKNAKAAKARRGK